MRASAGLFWAVSTAVLWGCGGNVEVATAGAAGGAGGTGGAASSSGDAGDTTGVTTTASAGGTTDTGTITSTVDDGCPGAPGDVFYVDVQVGGEQAHLTTACEFGDAYGPMAYAWNNGKSGPQWYFQINGCPEGGAGAPSVLIEAEVPYNAEVTVPYSTVGDINYTTSGQDLLGPAMSPSIVFNMFGPVHGVVMGKLTGTVVLPDGTAAPISGQFSVCRRSDIIFI